jgi:hypothetical protein
MLDRRPWAVVLFCVIGVFALWVPSARASLTWSAPTLIDSQQGYQDISINRISCPSATQCVAIDGNGNVLTSSNPAGGAGAWTIEHDDLSDANVLSCPATTLCVATSYPDHIYISTNPSGGPGAWRETQVGGVNEVSGLSCPTTSLCAATDGVSEILPTTDPAGGGGWSRTTLPITGLSQVTCTATELCVAIGDNGMVAVSNDPTGGPSAWNVFQIDPHADLQNIYCESDTECIADDDDGNVITSGAPAAGGGAWTVTNIVPSIGADLYSVACTALFCGVIYENSVYVSSTPLAGGWTPTSTTANGIFDLACTAAPLCVVGDEFGDIASSADPTAVSPTWTSAHVDGDTGLGGLACPSLSLCVATDVAGNILSTTTPADLTQPWSVAAADPGERLGHVACPSIALCVAVGNDGQVITSIDPGGRASAWTPTTIDGYNSFTDISCTGILCVAVDDVGQAFASIAPAAGAWTGADIDPTAGLVGVSCPSVTLCVAIDSNGYVLSSTDPTGGANAWSVTARLDSNTIDNPMQAISCPTIALCVVIEYDGDAIVSTDPTGGVAAWTTTTADPFGYDSALTCQSASLCLASSGDSAIATTANPAAGQPWTDNLITPSVSDAVVTAMSCPTAELCVAVDSIGNVTLGQQPPIPTATGAPSVAGTAVEGQNLTDVHAQWTGGPTGYTYQWQQCDPTGASCADIADATGHTYTLEAADVGHTVRVEEAAVNGGGTAEFIASTPTVVVTQAPPTDATTPIIAGTTATGQTLTLSHGSWAYSPTAFGDQWERCDNGGNGCNPIAGATAATYTLTSADIGSTIRVAETATNPAGTGGPVVSPPTAIVTGPSPPTSTEPIDNTPPVSGTPPINVTPPAISGKATPGATLVAQPGSWIGMSAQGFAYQWEICTSACAPIPAATSVRFTPNATEAGDTIRVAITVATTTDLRSTALSAPTTPVEPTATTVRHALTEFLAAHTHALVDVLEHHGTDVLRFTAPCAGRLTLTITSGHLLADGALAAKGPGTAAFTVRSANRQRLLRAARPTVVGTFTPRGGAQVTVAERSSAGTTRD